MFIYMPHKCIVVRGIDSKMERKVVTSFCQPNINHQINPFVMYKTAGIEEPSTVSQVPSSWIMPLFPCSWMSRSRYEAMIEKRSINNSQPSRSALDQHFLIVDSYLCLFVSGGV